jgi:lipopolysaccharide export LptBFGC system permease protein LptF
MRQNDRTLQKVASFEKLLIEKMPKIQLESKSAIEHLPISTLFSEIKKNHYSSSEEKACIWTYFYRKLAMPLLPLFILLAIPPYLFVFTRTRRNLLLSSLALFIFIAFFMLIDALSILGENQVISPFLAIWPPFIFLFGYFGKRFLMMR